MSMRERLKAYKIEPVKMDVPGLGEVYLKPLSAGEALEMQASSASAKLDGAADAWNREFFVGLLVKMVCDKTGKLELTEDDAAALWNLPFETIQMLFQRASDISGLGAKSQDAIAGK